MTENIYGLFDPERPDEVMYVGRTKRDPNLRLQSHYYTARHRVKMGKELLPITEWLLSLKSSGKVPGIRLLEVVEDGDAYLAEWAWIEKLKSCLNMQGNTRSDAKWHGTSGGYTNHKCRCVPCKKAWAAIIRAGKLRRAESVPAHSIGSENYYGNYGCRCRPCRTVWAAATKDRRSRRSSMGDLSGNIGKSNRGAGKLDKGSVTEIVNKYRAGANTEELAIEYGVTNAAISLALRGRIHG